MVCDHGICVSDRQRVLVRFAPRHSLEKLIWFGLALQLFGSALNVVFSLTGANQTPSVLFGTHMIVMLANAFVMSNSVAGAISVPPEAAGTASGAMGFLQQGIGALVSQFGAYLGGHSTTTLPLTSAIFVISLACASTMFFIVPRRKVIVSEKLIEQAEEEEIRDDVGRGLSSLAHFLPTACPLRYAGPGSGRDNEGRRRSRQNAKPQGDGAKPQCCAQSCTRAPACDGENHKAASREVERLARELADARERHSRDRRSAEPDRGRADRSAAGVRPHRQERGTAVPERAERGLPPRRRRGRSGRARQVLARVDRGGAEGLPCPACRQEPDLGRDP